MNPSTSFESVVAGSSQNSVTDSAASLEEHMRLELTALRDAGAKLDAAFMSL